jgi:hypothetical protein
MTRDEITRMAREAGMQGMLTDVVTTLDELERFAKLVAAAEREACARVCDWWNVSHCAAAIRARSNA